MGRIIALSVRASRSTGIRRDPDNPFLPLTAPTDVQMSWTSPSEGVLSRSEAVRSAVGFRLELLYGTPFFIPLGTSEVASHSVVVPHSRVPRGDYTVIIRGIDAFGRLGPASPRLDIDVDVCVRPPPPPPTLNLTVTGGLVSIVLRADSPDTFDACRLYAGCSPGASDLRIVDVTTARLSVPAPPGSTTSERPS